jgi:antirestriction protein
MYHLLKNMEKWVWPFFYDYSMDDAQTMLEEHYQGCHDSEVDFAKQLFDDCYAHQLPDSLSCYFDYEAFARDLFSSDYCSVEFGGQMHVFSID